MPPFAGLMATPAFSSPRLATFGMPADREHHLVGGDARTVRQMRGEFVAVLVDLVDGAAGEDGDALLLHLGADMRADVLVEAAQDVVAAIDHASRRSRSRRRCRRIPARCSRRPGSRCASAVRADETPRSRRSRARCRGFAAVVGRAAGRDQDVFRGDRLAGQRAAPCGRLPAPRGSLRCARRISRHWRRRCLRAARSPCPCWRPASASRR